MGAPFLPFLIDLDFEVISSSLVKGTAGDERRIAGFVTTDKIDQQGERLIQEGLDFSHFLTKGHFNDNHTRDTAGVVGEPDSVVLVEKGSKLPNGKVADKRGHYVEGRLYEGTRRADDIWELATAMSKSKSKRKLGFSVEGKVQRRVVKDGVPHVAAAIVRNVAITNCPVNDDTALEVLAKSLDALDRGIPFEKAMSVGAATSPGVPHGVPITGAGAGRVVMPQSLEGKRKKKRKRPLSKAEGVFFVLQRWPHLSARTAERIYMHAARNRSTR